MAGRLCGGLVNPGAVAGRRGDVLSVQIDGLDEDDRTWSVTVTGLAIWASPDEFESERFKRITDCGTSLIILPLSVVSGQRAH